MHSLATTADVFVDVGLATMVTLTEAEEKGVDNEAEREPKPVVTETVAA